MNVNVNAYVKLMQVQVELKAPKNQYNSFGKYKYRSCEDIQEAVKPLEAKHKVALFLSDEPVMIGERHYIKATATFVDLFSGETVQNTGYAREEENKKGMDGSQVTGTASSYARKYALNGLFLIDDTKDADTDEYRAQEQKPQKDSKDFVVRDGYGTKVLLRGGYKYIRDIELTNLETLLTMEQYKAAHEDIKHLLESTQK